MDKNTPTPTQPHTHTHTHTHTVTQSHIKSHLTSPTVTARSDGTVRRVAGVVTQGSVEKQDPHTHTHTYTHRPLSDRPSICGFGVEGERFLPPHTREGPESSGETVTHTLTHTHTHTHWRMHKTD